MANNPLPYDVAGIASVNAVAALCNLGFMNIYTGSQPALDGSLTGTLLASLPFQTPAFATATASSGTVTAVMNGPISAVASATGTAGYFALLETNGTTIVGTGSVGLSAADLNFSSLSIQFGGTVSCFTFSITEPQN